MFGPPCTTKRQGQKRIFFDLRKAFFKGYFWCLKSRAKKNRKPKYIYIHIYSMFTFLALEKLKFILFPALAHMICIHRSIQYIGGICESWEQKVAQKRSMFAFLAFFDALQAKVC